MKDEKIIRIAAMGFVGFILVPIVVGATLNLIGLTVGGISKIAYNRKIKKGLKEGSKVEMRLNGNYYEVKIDNVEEA